MSRTLRGKAAVVGIGETPYYKHGASPDAEFLLALKAILAACEDCGISPREIDGFASYSNDRSNPNRLAAALGIPEIRFSSMQWGGGGGGAAAPVGAAAMAIATGTADCVVVFRSLAQGQFGRFGLAPPVSSIQGEYAHAIPWGLISPPQMFAMKVRRFMHDHAVDQEALRSIALASYAHAQNNPRAVMYGRPLDERKYDESRWITEPFHLFDCCQENDGAAAAILVSAERARQLKRPPAYILSAASGAPFRSDAWAHNAPDYGSSHFKTVAPRLFDAAGITPADVDVLQSYENFTGGVLMSIIENGFCAPSDANTFFTKDNLLAPSGKLPLNTSGGNLAECYMHGFALVNEAVRQIRGESVNQVADVAVSMMTGGPMVTPVSACIFGTGDTL